MLTPPRARPRCAGVPARTFARVAALARKRERRRAPLADIRAGGDAWRPGSPRLRRDAGVDSIRRLSDCPGAAGVSPAASGAVRRRAGPVQLLPAEPIELAVPALLRQLGMVPTDDELPTLLALDAGVPP